MSRLYFAFGSNMKTEQLKERLDEVEKIGIATLQDYVVAFNKESKKDGTGKANIVHKPGVETFGVIYGLSEDQLKSLDNFEKGYYRIPVHVVLNGEVIHAQTYVAVGKSVNNNLLPTADYLGLITDGAGEHGLPEDYQNFLKSFGVCK